MSENIIPFADAVAGSIKKAANEAGAKSRDLYFMPLASLRKKDGFNVRIDTDEYKAKVREYADSMKANGFYADKPISVFIVNEDGANIGYIVDGHTRFDAAELAVKEGAEIETVPIVAVPNGTTAEDITIGLVTKNSGRPLSPYEVGIVCKRLVDMGMEEAEIARRLTKGVQYIRGLLQLVGAPKAVREMVTAGNVSATLAIDTLKKEGSNAAKVLKQGAQVAQELGKSKVTKKAVKKATAPAPAEKPKKGKKAAVEPQQAPAADTLDLAEKLIKVQTSALNAVMKSNVWEAMSETAQKIVTNAYEAGVKFQHGDAQTADASDEL